LQSEKAKIIYIENEFREKKPWQDLDIMFDAGTNQMQQGWQKKKTDDDILLLMINSQPDDDILLLMMNFYCSEKHDKANWFDSDWGKRQNRDKVEHSKIKHR
jgi:hypothetical protein